MKESKQDFVREYIESLILQTDSVSARIEIIEQTKKNFPNLSFRSLLSLFKEYTQGKWKVD